MVTVWVYIPLFARILGIFGYANLDNFVAKKWHLSANFLWVTYYAGMNLWPSMIADMFKGIVMAVSLPRTKKYRDELLERSQEASI